VGTIQSKSNCALDIRNGSYLNFRLGVALALLFAVAVVTARSIYAEQSRLAFEVVSIKEAPQPTAELVRSGSGLAFDVDAARVRILGFTPLALLARAFRVETPQVDTPDFARSEYFEIQATLPAGATREQVPEMLQTMFAERFKLAYHRETREYLMSVLTVGKGGMKLPRLPNGVQVPPSTSTQLPDGSTRMTQTGNVKSLFPVMNSFGGLQMVDETGLDGIYTWVRVLPPVTPGITYQDRVQEAFQAMIEAAGLRLEKRKVPKETIVVDHLEKMPTEN
jgi:uncharacterized protein (TIGR03435 family)